jgi:hypothetical protein
MNKNQIIVRNTLAASLLIFPTILLVAFTMHFNSIEDFFTFKLKYPAYNSDGLFNLLVKTGGGSFIHAHAVAYFSVPFMILTILCLGYLLYPKKPMLSFIGVSVGIIGSVFMAGVFASWISFTAVSKVEPQYYVGAKAALTELTRMTGALKMITTLSFLSLIGIIILCIGFLRTTLLPKWSPLTIMMGCAIICIFMDLDNWMFIGSVLILIGLMPVSRILKNKAE